MMSNIIIDSMYENLIIELFNTEQSNFIDSTFYIFLYKITFHTLKLLFLFFRIN